MTFHQKYKKSLKEYQGFAFIIQARMGSSRLPGKTLLHFQGATILGHLLDSLCQQGANPQNIIVATSNNPLDEVIQNYVASLGITVHRGEEKNVLKRYQDAAKLTQCKNIVRLTSDNPLLDFNLLYHCMKRHEEGGADLTSTRELNEENQVIRYVPKGSSIDIFSKNSLIKINSNEVSPFEQEHVIPHFFRTHKVNIIKDFQTQRPSLSIDTLEDYKDVCAYATQLQDKK